MTMPQQPCPKCGTLNAPKAGFCNLCQATLAPKIPPPGVQALSGNADESGNNLSGNPSLRARPMLLFTDAERHNVRMSLLLFVLLFGVFILLGVVFGEAYGDFRYGLALAVVLYTILAGAAYFGGSDIVLSFHDAAKADPKQYQQLQNVVQEMCIASGMPLPEIYVMPSSGMNAFAAGKTPQKASIAVTQGLLDQLGREELQGVIAHEIAHIKSRDTLYNIYTAVLVGAIALLSDTFLRTLGRGGRSRSSGKGRGNIAFLILGIALALLAPLAAKVLQMSISRQREYHADAAAAEFTRNPLGLASALSKIASGSAHVPGESRGTQHLFIINPLKDFSENASALLSTHPATTLRIRRLRAMAGLTES